MTERDMETHPYSPDELRVVEYISKITKDQVGGGDDPIGFLIASYAYLLEKIKREI